MSIGCLTTAVDLGVYLGGKAGSFVREKVKQGVNSVLEFTAKDAEAKKKGCQEAQEKLPLSLIPNGGQLGAKAGMKAAECVQNARAKVAETALNILN